MKLQINLHGSWRDVMSFSVEKAQYVRYYAGTLSMLADKPARLRIVMPDGLEVTDYYEPGQGWRSGKAA